MDNDAADALMATAGPVRRPDADPVARFLTWARDEARFAFQPIVDPYTGSLYGVEALMRGHQDLDFHSVHDFFDFSFRIGILQQVEVLLRGRARLLLRDPASLDGH